MPFHVYNVYRINDTNLICIVTNIYIWSTVLRIWLYHNDEIWTRSIGSSVTPYPLALFSCIMP